ncbi:cell division protein FtsZ [Candidatus Sumerlaeota bacterium]|nr:cell division protein FtsZ [Candidatus Sumerlaeota bacterium]
MKALEIEQELPQPTCIKVIGIGGGGCNTVSDMFNMGINNVEFYAINTDVQSLKICQCPNKIQIGKDLTNGLGAGSNPEIGEQAALAAKDVITEILKGADMVFITAGFGGGTGTGAAPVVAQLAKEMGILTVAVVTRPFRFEGPKRMQRAEEGIEKIRQICDTVIAISNERLLEVVGNKALLVEAFHIANNVLSEGVKSISELITTPGLINVDFADIRTIMGISGGAVMGVGIGKGENRAVEAVKKACSNQLLDKIVIEGAKGILICINAPPDLTLQEINEATTLVYEAADDEANIIFGAVINENLKDEVKVTMIATGFKEETRKDGRYKKQLLASSEPTRIQRRHQEYSTQQEELTPQNSDRLEPESVISATPPRIEIKPDIFADEENAQADNIDDKLSGVNAEETEVSSEKEQSSSSESVASKEKTKKAEKQPNNEYEIPSIFRRRRLIF